MKFGESKYKYSLEENILNKSPKFLMKLQKKRPIQNNENHQKSLNYINSAEKLN